MRSTGDEKTGAPLVAIAHTGTRSIALRAVAVAAAASILAACSFSAPSPAPKRAKEFFSEAEYGKASPRVVHAGPVPKGGGRAMVGKEYRVAGKTYIPRDVSNYSATGLASWYGAAFHGRQTANGEIYDLNGLTAAHPTLPLPSYARVTNTKNGRSVIVRINDRGPFARDRIIDVSARVADLLDFKNAGTAKVHVDYMGPAQMDGLDEQMLLASYREGRPGERGPSDDGFANTIMVAQAPLPRQRPVAARAFDAGGAFDQPAFSGESDLLGPLILRTSFANGYAAVPARSAAQRAADELAVGATDNLQSALDRAVARRAHGTAAAPDAVVIRLGAFSNDDNAARVAGQFSRFGKTTVREDGALNVVEVQLNAGVAADDVVGAAAAIGLKGAFAVR